jgi:hypothetical protein
VNVGQRGNVAGGDVGVAAGMGSTLTAQTDARVALGQVLLAQTVTLQDRVQTGEIGANTINVGVNVTTGPRSAYVAPPAAPAIPAFTAGNTAVTVNGGQTQTLAPGDYGNVTVNGTLNLSGGAPTRSRTCAVGGPDGRLAANAASTVRIQTGRADQRSAPTSCRTARRTRARCG